MPDQRTEPRGPEILESDIELHRQIHPTWLDADGRPNSLLFRPSQKDVGLLSLADGRVRSPEQAWKFHSAQGLESAGTASLKTASFHTESIRVYSDQLIAPEDDHDDDAHVAADYRSLSSGSARRAAKNLRDRAVVTYRPTS